MSLEKQQTAYNPKEIEEKWYAFWEDQGFFRADNQSTKPSFCICIPPPNVTGVLHMGHALVDTLQDILIRWKRMLGFEALWVPGTDHAGIATQTVVERHLMATLGKRRTDFSREEFLQHVWEWKAKSEGQILSQLKKLGCSCDWSRLAFTMDEERNLAVRTMFKKMFDAGLIYRGDYLVNWDPVTQTALADDEVEYEQEEGFLWYFRYPLSDHSDFITIATTRPETVFGDTAIAVSPKDDRYAKFLGKTAIQPLSQRQLPIIADIYVDPEFGTGAVKITPAHDPNDYQIGLNHKLPLINVMTPDGKMNEEAGAFAGLTKEEARARVVEEMKARGFLVKVEPCTHRVGVSYRSKAIIEPYLSKQWFVKMEPFKKILRQTVEEKKVKLIPENWESTYFHWIDNLRDWCISRQLWWGHQIPIWYKKGLPHEMICYAKGGLPPEVEKNPDSYFQDPDVLDTWFSSALWPFSTLGWPNRTEDLHKFYPNSSLITGHDILFFWVARMVLMGEYALDTPPFPETFLHGLIYGKSYWRQTREGGITYVPLKERLEFDLGKTLPPGVHSKWEKMSKSKGNIIDPLEIIDAYGTDAMRLALCASATHARQIDLDRRRFEEFRNFTNKIWNGARFVFLNIESLSPEVLAQGLDLNSLQLEDRWILSLLNRAIQEVNGHLESYAFDKAAMTAYHFFWKEFCAYYVELVKPILFGKVGTEQDRATKQKILCIVLCNTIRLLHPMAPFITEELFQRLKMQFPALCAPDTIDPYTQETISALNHAACIVAPYPQVIRKEEMNEEIEKTFAFLDQIIITIRNIRAQMQITPGTPVDLYLCAPSHDPERQIAQNNINIIKALVRLQEVHFEEVEKSLPLSAHALVGNIQLIIPLPEELKEKEKVRLVAQENKCMDQINALTTQLANADFVAKAPAHLVEKTQNQLNQMQKELEEVIKKLKSFST